MGSNTIWGPFKALGPKHQPAHSHQSEHAVQKKDRSVRGRKIGSETRQHLRRKDVHDDLFRAPDSSKRNKNYKTMQRYIKGALNRGTLCLPPTIPPGHDKAHTFWKSTLDIVLASGGSTNQIRYLLGWNKQRHIHQIMASIHILFYSICVHWPHVYPSC